MDYCMCCGEKLTKKTATWYHCDANGHDVYRNPKASVGLVLYGNDNQLYLTRRKHEPYKGELDVPGGYVDSNENLEQALAREMSEEIGLKPEDYENLDYLTSIFNEYPWQGSTVPVVCVCFIAKLKQGVQLKPADDVESIEEFSMTNSYDDSDFGADWMPTIISATKRYLDID